MKKIIQIAPVHSGGQDGQSSLIHLFALCEDGKVWVQYQDFGGSDNPLDTAWQPVHVNPPVELDMDENDWARPIDIAKERLKAENGDCKAQYTLSEAYRLGMYGLPCDLNLAHVWRQRSQAPGDNYGNEVAQTNPTPLVTKLSSLPKSETEGAVFELVQAKAKAGDPHSQYRFGIALFHGEYSGVKIDRSETQGLYWIKKSADQGNGLAKSFLTDYDGKPVEDKTRNYEVGDKIQNKHTKEVHIVKRLDQRGGYVLKGVNGSYFYDYESIKLHWQPAPIVSSTRKEAPGDNYGNEVAQTNASSASTSIPCHRIVNLLMLAQAGTSEDQFNVGYAYYLNDGGNRREDLVESVKWFKMAAAQGHADAQSLLSNAYFTGEGVEKDTVLALYWHNQARISVKKEAQQ